jgi:hypothetical protein
MRSGKDRTHHGRRAEIISPAAFAGWIPSIALLVGLDERDPVTGIPRMSAIPVTLEQCDADSGSKSN